MRKIVPYLCLLLLAFLFACKKEDKQTAASPVPEEISAKLKTAGFDISEGLSKYKDGYLVEYDIFLTADQINTLAAEKTDKKPQVEHYTTNNLVSSPRTLRIYMDAGFDAYMQSSFDQALGRYNAQHLGLSFQRAASSGAADISIFSFYEVSNVLGYSAGFPVGGNPASPIRLNTYYYNNSSHRADALTVIAHEIGHAIGYRHTDYMNRAFSCGSGGSEGDAGVGANPVLGTPTAPSAGSWMLACSSNTDRPFTFYDRIALVTTYPGTYPGNTAPLGKIISLKARINNKYVCAENGGANALIANRDAVGPWEQFRVIDAGNGLIALQSLANNSYVCAEAAGASPLIANRSAIGLWERFRWITNSDGSVSLQAFVSNSYVAAENAGAASLIANREVIGDWEKYSWQQH
ncbi:M57 family metalloprotease [Chitinophaga nivalis]|uniref:M57 family metalloprotease n=1 Tax=Chitinophaga nivalis TaxID=2991709 RepID=A0ABT3IRI5_9BACT|nr:M57 family metalloprotease [Chitinophaga nivalis]MCW3463986.1 M57 family metalloprotease [Chitinophaga nivalis]MCW3486324.1 M57 family metalloprotease [Chitinophaga nivalis]